MAAALFILGGFVVGIVVTLLVKMSSTAKMKKEIKSLKGLLESERLIRETAQKENQFLLQSADAALLTTKEKLAKAEQMVRQMDTDILLLQKSNEETEAMMAGAEPALHEMKLRLIEAQNTIARYKALTGEK